MRKIVYISVIIILLLIINGLVHSSYSLWEKQKLVDQARKELDIEQQKNKQIKAQLSQATSYEFIEEQARNKLMLVKPQEQQVILSERLIKEHEKEFVTRSQEPVWKQWVLLFTNPQ